MGSYLRGYELLVSIILRTFIDLLGSGLSRGIVLEGDDDDDYDVVSVPPNYIHCNKGQISKILCHGNENERYEPANV